MFVGTCVKNVLHYFLNRQNICMCNVYTYAYVYICTNKNKYDEYVDIYSYMYMCILYVYFSSIRICIVPLGYRMGVVKASNCSFWTIR